MQLRLLAPRYWLTWAGLGLLRLVALLPFPWIVFFGKVLGALLRRVAIGFVRTARRNLELCFPELTAE
jgi:KDO2-lipid IV(A) lauroyltransferase